MSSEERRYPQRPLVGIGVVILVGAANRITGVPSARPAPYGVVLVKRRFEPMAGEWSLPGGLIEIGETLEAAVARETFEETGLIVTVGAVLGVFDRIILDDEAHAGEAVLAAGRSPRPGAAQDLHGRTVSGTAVAAPVRHHYVIIDFLCQPVGGELRAGSDASEVVIANPADLAAYRLTPTIEAVIGRALALAG